MPASITDILARNLATVKTRIARACNKSHRIPDDVRLVAVTKAAQADWIRGLIELGQVDLGENRPQQLAQRAAVFPGSARWHLIGHLQRNKVDQVLPIAECIHSVDSLRLLQSLSKQAAKTGRLPRILLEVNVSGEPSKSGFSPAELMAAWDGIPTIDNVSLVGLMTMAPFADDPELTRPVFRGLRELRGQLVNRSGGKLLLPELSMGMSGDFEVAVEEGATMIRIGSRLFEGLEGNDE